MTAHLSVTFPRATFIPRAAVPVGRSSAAPLRRRALLFPPGFPLPVWTRRRCAHPPTVAPPGGAAARASPNRRATWGRSSAARIPQSSRHLGAQPRCAPTSPRAAIPARVPAAGSDAAALRPSPNRRAAWGRSSAAPLHVVVRRATFNLTTCNLQPSTCNLHIDHRLICRRQRSRSVVTTSPDGVSTSGGVSTCAPYALYLTKGLDGSLVSTGTSGMAGRNPY